MLREQRRRREELHGRTVLGEFYKEHLQSARRSFSRSKRKARPWTRRGNGFLRHSLRWGGPPSTHLRACGLTIVEAGERSSDCALLRSALLLARSQLNWGVRQTKPRGADNEIRIPQRRP
jgi:hypothetical protein